MLSPSTSLPFSCRSSATTKESNCFSMQAVRSLKFFRSSARPPVVQIALRVVLRALIVEAVGHLMADHRADAAVVERVVGRGIEERRLQNARGKDDFVHVGIVVGVDGRRGHVPFAAVHGLIDLGQLAMELESIAALEIVHVGIARHAVSGIVAPLVRIADLEVHGGQLGQRLLARGIAHPGKRFDIGMQCRDQVLHHLVRARLGLRRKRLCTYFWPSACPSSRSVEITQRFQRG